MNCMVREVRYQKGYLLGTDWRLLQNVSARDPCYKTDHCRILGCLCRDALRKHT